ncbi:MAG: hypothetical protein JJE22_12930, partial [Bacteroidia bacterium]|nr:hypothetical protein [Bacteroidia bacterium]
SKVKFKIVIRHDGRYIRLIAEQIYLSDQLEKYRVTAKNKTLTFQSNSPLLRTRGLKYKKPDWKIIEGNLDNSYLTGEIISQIQIYIEAKEKKMNGGGWS